MKTPTEEQVLQILPELFISLLVPFRPVRSVTVAEQSEACTVFARSKAGIVGSNPTQGMDVWYVHVFILFVLSCV
jgi:hypothetical protein